MKQSLEFTVTGTPSYMQLTEVRVSGKTENEAVGCQSLITHCAVINREMVVDQVALCVFVCVCMYKNSSQLPKEQDRGRGT